MDLAVEVQSAVASLAASLTAAHQLGEFLTVFQLATYTFCQIARTLPVSKACHSETQEQIMSLLSTAHGTKPRQGGSSKFAMVSDRSNCSSRWTAWYMII